MDGLTTNGVLIMHPKGKFCGGNAKCGLWRETSLGGEVFSLRESRSAQQKGQPVSITQALITTPQKKDASGGGGSVGIANDFSSSSFSFLSLSCSLLLPLCRLRMRQISYKMAL